MAQMKGQHIDQFLTNYSQRYSNAAFINEVLFPQVMVEKESDLYPVYGMEMFNVYETRRANGARNNEGTYSVTNARYATEEYNWSDIVTDRERANADNPLNPEIDTVEYVQDALDLEKENRAALLARNAANYATANKKTLSGTSQWSDYTDGASHPLLDIKTAQAAIFTSSRKMPNTIILPMEVALTLAHHPDVVDYLKYTHPDMLTSVGLPSVLLGVNVTLAGAAYNSANRGQTTTLAGVWGKDVIFAYTEPGARLKSIQFGKTFRVSKYTKKWRDESRSGDVIENNDINSVNIVSAACGYLLQSVIA